LSKIVLKSLLILSIVFSCAKQARPPGGPVDKTPPFVISALPENGSVEVDVNTDVQVLFSEGVNPVSAKDAIFITPFQGDNAYIKFRGRKIVIKFRNPLESDKTYVITFGTNISDYRSNKMDSSFTLAFSTGHVLDQGRIEGRVFRDKDLKGVDVWAYQFDKDSPDPSESNPDYIVQCAEDGSFKFDYMSPGKYRIFAVKDNFADKLYQPEEDEIGVCFKDAVLIRDSTVVNKDFLIRMTREDTTFPVLQRAVSVTCNRVAMQFSEPVLYDTCKILIKEKQKPDSLKIKFLWDTGSNVLFAETGIQQDADYKITLSGIYDFTGNPVDTVLSSFNFHGTARRDTIAPVITGTVPSSGEKFADVSGKITIDFSEPVDTFKVNHNIALTDTALNPVPCKVTFSNVNSLLIEPEINLKSSKMYKIVISSGSIGDLYGNVIKDTTIVFTTVNTDTLGSIAGEITDPEEGSKGEIYINAIKIDKPIRNYQVVLAEPGDFEINNVLPGHYMLSAFRDSNSDKLFNFGRPFPFIPSERFAVFPDTVVVKSRWTNQDNVLKLPAK